MSTPALHEANVLTPANLQFELPLGVSQQTGTCTLDYDQTIFAVAPHMHARGIHLKTTLHQGDAAQVLFDADFDFTRQAYTSITPVSAHAGDRVTVECTWNNTTSHPIAWGSTSNDEMCNTMLYRYPQGDGHFCTK